MTHPQAIEAATAAAYRQGVADVLDLARRSADALEASTKRPLAVNFAIEALRALADEAERSLLGLAGDAR